MTTQAQIDKLKADAAQMRADVNLIVPTGPVTSPDNTVIPPATSINALGVTAWTIRAADKVIMRDSTATNGHATSILWHKGVIYVKSPNAAAHWWQWLGPNSWKDLGSVDPMTL